MTFMDQCLRLEGLTMTLVGMTLAFMDHSEVQTSLLHLCMYDCIRTLNVLVEHS